MSFPLIGKMVILNQLKDGDHLLLLYEEGVEIYRAFKAFIDAGLKNKELCLYAFDPEYRGLVFDYYEKYIKSGQLHTFPLKAESNFTDQLLEKIEEISHQIGSNYTALRLLINFGRIVDPGMIEGVVYFENEINRMKRKLLRKSWSRKHYKNNERFYPSLIISSFDVNGLDYELIERLIDTHEKILICTKNESVALLPNFSANPRLHGMPSLETIPSKILDHLTKKNLRVIALALLSQRSMCGYELIKTIFQKFHVFVSQGSIYPLLHSLEEEGLLEVELDNRTIIYHVAEECKEAVKEEVGHFGESCKYLLGLIK